MDVCEYFEGAASTLGLSADTLTNLVKQYEVISESEWEELNRNHGIEIADISAVRVQYLLMFPADGA